MGSARVLFPDHSDPRALVASESLTSQLDMLLASGGGGDGFGLGAALAGGTRPAPTEIWFGSTGYSAIGLRGYQAALSTLGQLISADPTLLSPNRWLDDLRQRIASVVAGTPDCAVLFTPGIGEARALARSIAVRMTDRTMREIAAEADEAAHFLPADEDEYETVEVAFRDHNGDRRTLAEIDGDMRAAAAEALCEGHGILLHVLDTSKTGLSGPSRRMARGLSAVSPGRVFVLIDATELRCDAQTLKEDLAQGHMVLITGSHFAGGPPACAALLLPRDLAVELATREPILAPAGITRFDIPGELRPTFVLDGGLMNLGLGLRWSAAIAELEAYALVPEETRHTILAAFSRKARHLAAICSGIDPEARPLDDTDNALRESIVPLIVDQPHFSIDPQHHAQTLHESLVLPCGVSVGDVACHLGPPVRFGATVALTVSASAPMVAEVGARIAKGIDFEIAFGPVKRDLATLFGKLDMLQALV